MSLDSGLGSSPAPSTTSSLRAPPVATTPAATSSSNPWSRFTQQASSAADRVGSALSSGYNYVGSNARNYVTQANNYTNQGFQNLKSGLTDFQSRLGSYDQYLGNITSGTSALSKIIFLVAVVVGFLILVSVGTKIITAATTYSKKPYLLKNLKSGTEQMVIPQDPRTAHSVPLLRSSNQEPGIEFTYSTWIFIDELPRIPAGATGPMYKHVFHQGSPDKFTSEGLSQPINTPGLYIMTQNDQSTGTDQNLQEVSLMVVMSTFDDPMESIIIRDIPLEKWINVVVVLKGQVLDVYVNGTIAGRHMLKGVPMQSYGPLNMSLNGGFTGKMSTTQYFAYALSPVQIANIASVNPSLVEASGGIENPFPPYLSLRWYTGSSSI
jgi:hypothetical protein